MTTKRSEAATALRNMLRDIESRTPGTWNPDFGQHCYSDAAEKIRRAEIAMTGRGSRFVIMKAPKLIWC